MQKKIYFVFFLLYFFLSGCLLQVNKTFKLSLKEENYKKPIKLNYIKELGKNELLLPHGIDIDLNNYLYIADYGKNRIVRINLKDSKAETFISFREKIFCPIEVVIDLMYIYIINKGEQTIKKYDLNGQLLQSIENIITEFCIIESLAIDNLGNLYLVDKANDRILKISSSGEFLEEFGCFGKEENQFDNPTSIAITSNYIYIADTGNCRIQKYDRYHNFILSIGKDKLFSPSALAVDHFGNIIGIDSKNNQIYFFDPNGFFLFSFKNGLNQPADLVLTKDNHLFVTDTLNNRVIEYEIIYK